MLNIKQRQMNLKFLNFYKKGIDGIEGVGTKQAYKEFQKAYNLTVDGIYGAKTDNMLAEVIKSIQNKIGANVDGVVGANTVAKCKEYQSKNGLTADGICGVNTRAKLNAISWDNIKYFKQSEFTCKCGCGLNNIDLRLVQVLDNIREHFGQACVVTSGTRCVKHNKTVGGVSNSKHIIGHATDIYVRNVSGKDLLAYTKKLVAEGKLRYTYLIVNNAVHVDIN